MTHTDLARYVKTLALELGFDRCGVARAEPLGRREYLRDWLDKGCAGSMEYLHRHLTARDDPREVLDGAKSVIVVALSYFRPDSAEPATEAVARGRVAMYAWGEDYHKVIKRKLLALADRLRRELVSPFDFKACVDTVPILERELAAAAGIGWIGKNGLAIDRHLGSYFFLGELVTTLDIAADGPVAKACGHCTACLDACPTGALLAPHRMDASRCISYLTLEHRAAITDDLQPLMGDWVFGCDICQQVCPYNRRAAPATESGFRAQRIDPRPVLDDILAWTEEQYRAALRGTATRRATLRMWQRNAGIAKANASRRSGEG